MNSVATAVAFYHKYADAWERDSQHFHENGYYDWMASKLPASSLVLEIGCGNGFSTQALLSLGHRVVSLEENPVCLTKAYGRLKNKTTTVKIKRSKLIDCGKKYRVEYAKIPVVRPDANCILLDANLMLDEPKTLDFLGSFRFDAVVCWLIGTTGHILSNCVNLEPMSKLSPQGYRLGLQNKIYDNAHKWLKPNGIVHIVDRGEFTEDPELIQDYIDSHVAQAEPTKFRIISDSFDQIQYNPLDIGQGMKMGFSPGSSGRIPEVYTHGMWSILATLCDNSKK